MSGRNIPEASRTLGEQSGSAKSHIENVETIFNKIEKEHTVFRGDLEQLKRSMHQLKEKIRNNPADLRKYVADKMSKLQDDAVLSEEQQKMENRVVQQSLTEIKRENRETQENIAKTLTKLKDMEARVGAY